MSCYHPLVGYIYGQKANGKLDMHVTASRIPPTAKPLKTIDVPCGQCIGCRLDRARDWANRCMLELKYHTSSYFLTLTYDDAHVPYSSYPNPNAPDVPNMSLTLNKRDYQLFLKRLRKSGQKVRYFLCGEYGENTFRPHYHAIVFGLVLDDLQLYKQTSQGFNLYTSPSLSKLWGLGHIVVADVTWESCCYTARYITKKLNGEEGKIYGEFNIQAPFAVASRRPGLARKYYEDNNPMRFTSISISTPSKGLKFPNPRYFSRLYELDNPDDYAVVRDRNMEYAESVKLHKLSKTSENEVDYLATEEYNKITRTKGLVRNFKE